MNNSKEQWSVDQLKAIVSADEIQQVLNSEIARTRLLDIDPHMSEANIQFYSSRSNNPWDVDIIYLIMQLKAKNSTNEINLNNKNLMDTKHDTI